ASFRSPGPAPGSFASIAALVPCRSARRIPGSVALLAALVVAPDRSVRRISGAFSSFAPFPPVGPLLEPDFPASLTVLTIHGVDRGGKTRGTSAPPLRGKGEALADGALF